MNQEWIVWDGEVGGYGMPARLLPTSHVQIMCRDRDTECGLATSFEWSHSPLSKGKDIIQYRIVNGPAVFADNINQPSHYTAGKVEAIDAIEAATTGLEGIEAVCTANVIKYIWRWKLKNGLEDLKKARWYLDRLISKIENNS